MSPSRLVPMAPVLACLAGLACSVPREQTIIADFLSASRLRDFTTLSKLSTTIYEPREQGTISTFEVQEVGPERVDGDLIEKVVTVLAPVRLPDGRTVRKTLKITLQRPRSLVEGRPLYGGWKVVAVH